MRWTRGLLDKPCGRGRYAVAGFVLFALKYNLDRLILESNGIRWLPWNYLAPGREALVRASEGIFALLLAISLPFIAVGVVLTIQRLHSIGWPRFLVALFFVPIVNLVFFALLILQPDRREPEATEGGGTRRRLLVLANPWAAASAAVILTSLLATVMALVAGEFLQFYGWGLFVGIPFVQGCLAAWIAGLHSPRTIGVSLGAASASVTLVAILLVTLAVEGMLCIGMAAPIALVLALLGGCVGHCFQIARATRQGAMPAYFLAWLVLPGGLATERAISGPPPVYAVVSSLEIAATPETVWHHVVAFADIPPPAERLFTLGVAHPVRARIDGTGVGAVRYCEFSTGPFVEPITKWDPPIELAFDVESQPPPMNEWSPWSSIKPAHLNAFFTSRRGRFLLTRLDDGRTRLEGTTWYEQKFWPAPYWKLWSDWIVHRIHFRVLEHIRSSAETGVKET